MYVYSKSNFGSLTTVTSTIIIIGLVLTKNCYAQPLHHCCPRCWCPSWIPVHLDWRNQNLTWSSIYKHRVTINSISALANHWKVNWMIAKLYPVWCQLPRVRFLYLCKLNGLLVCMHTASWPGGNLFLPTPIYCYLSIKYAVLVHPKGIKLSHCTP